MLSAPASIPATIVATFPAGLAPLSVGSRTRSVTASCRPACWARRITGTRPAHDTRFGSSNVARTTGASWRSLTCEVPFRARR